LHIIFWYHPFQLKAIAKPPEAVNMPIAHVSSLLTTFALLAQGREIIFPPVSGFSQQPIFEQGGIDISAGSAFAGLTTYANLPYVHCLAGKNEEVEKYDIAILGAPFDTVSCISYCIL
jgi:agmatinase